MTFGAITPILGEGEGVPMTLSWPWIITLVDPCNLINL